MTEADKYRKHAAEFAAQAKNARSETLRTEFASMSAAYRRLAQQAERNAENDDEIEQLAERMVANPTRKE